LLVDTRNLEINLFWQRSNYFLVLNSAIALGFVNVSKLFMAITLAFIGLCCSLLWFWVCLGSKFWQSRWEQRLGDFEREHMPKLAFFSASQERMEEDARKGLTFHRNMSWSQRAVYTLALKRPSVTYAMIRLSLVFLVGWFVFLALCVFLQKHPLQ
jgi:hypothetical protein